MKQWNIYFKKWCARSQGTKTKFYWKLFTEHRNIKINIPNS